MNTLQNIRQHTNKLQRLIEYSINYRSNNLNSFKKSFGLFQMGAHKTDIIKAFDADIKSTADDVIKILPILASENNGVLQEFDGSDNTIEGIFGDLYDKEQNTVNISGVDFSFYEIKNGSIDKQEIISRLVYKIFNTKYTSYKNTVANLTKFDKVTGIKKLLLVAIKRDSDKILNVINKMLCNYQSQMKQLSISERIIVDKEITFNRTMIDGVIQNSSYISDKKGVEQLQSKHKGKIEKLQDYLSLSQYVDSIEIEKETDPEKVISVLNQLENFNLNTIRKL